MNELGLTIWIKGELKTNRKLKGSQIFLRENNFIAIISKLQ